MDDRGFLQKALVEEGFKQLDDFQGVDAVELARGWYTYRDLVSMEGAPS